MEGFVDAFQLQIVDEPQISNLKILTVHKMLVAPQ